MGGAIGRAAVLGVVLAAWAAEAPRAAEPAAPAGRSIEYDVAGERVPAYLALPASGSARGGVVVVHEWWGLNDQIRAIADRLAARGYAAIAPDLYRGELAAEPERAHELMRGLQDGRAIAILRYGASYLRATEEAAGRKVAVIGFCMGGHLALLTALGNSEVGGAVMFYGRPVIEKDKLESLSVPVLGLFGADDHGIPVADVKAFERTAKELGKKIEVKIYPGAGHAFFNETRPSHNAEAAADAWKLTLAFLEKTLAK